MIELLVILVAGVLIIAAATVFGPRLGVASPLVLVAVGVAASFLPVFTSLRIEPELVLEGILPPLLYAAAASMPTMNFRREIGAISGLSVLLLVGSALILGLFFTLVIPGLPFVWGVALGAIVSPTDAISTSIVKRMPASKRVVTLLDGESLLNDATALVLLRTAIVAAAAAFSFWGAVGTFAYAIVVAAVVGWLVGWLNLELRKHVINPTVNTVISFTVPFIASIPAGLLGGSGLVAAVVAGLILSKYGPRYLSPQNRLSDLQNWRTVELLLEGAIFLTMGVQIKSIVTSVQEDDAGAPAAILIAGGALLLAILIRVTYIAPLLRILSRLSKHGKKLHSRLRELKPPVGAPDDRPHELNDRRVRRRPLFVTGRRWVAFRVDRTLADIDYFHRQPLGWREGFTLVWAGMRGAITVAAAQTLPEETPFRSTLVLIAFTVAVLSLLIQGATLGPLLRLIGVGTANSITDEYAAVSRARIVDLLQSKIEELREPELDESVSRPRRLDTARSRRLELIQVQRSTLLDARDTGIFDAEALEDALAHLDADQIFLETSRRTSSHGEELR